VTAYHRNCLFWALVWSLAVATVTKGDQLTSATGGGKLETALPDFYRVFIRNDRSQANIKSQLMNY